MKQMFRGVIFLKLKPKNKKKGKECIIESIDTDNIYKDNIWVMFPINTQVTIWMLSPLWGFHIKAEKERTKAPLTLTTCFYPEAGGVPRAQRLHRVFDKAGEVIVSTWKAMCLTICNRGATEYGFNVPQVGKERGGDTLKPLAVPRFCVFGRFGWQPAPSITNQTGLNHGEDIWKSSYYFPSCVLLV